jgi:isopenicillin-N N-acyltransferase-like protein
MVQSCPVFELSGRPYERGRRYGELAGSLIQKGVSHYLTQITLLGLESRELHEIIQDTLPVIESFDAGLLEEMGGIAAGAHVSLDEIVLLNARTELLKLAAHPELRRRLPSSVEPDGCTAIVAQPSATRDGDLIHAHNWDWKYESAESSVVLRIRNEDGPDLLTFTEAGGLARFGFNSVGIGITGNYLESDRDYRQVGVPLALIRRKVLEQQCLAPAVAAVYSTAKSGSNNIILSHASGLVIDFECAPDETFVVDPEDGILVHTNHWRSPVALGKLKDTGIASAPCSLVRDRRARWLLRPMAGRLAADDVKEVLFDAFDTPWSICRPPRPSTINNLSATVAMLVMTPADGRMQVAMLPALNREFSTFRLEMDSAAQLSPTPKIVSGANS